MTISFETGKGNPDLPRITAEIETTDRVVSKNRLFHAGTAYALFLNPAPLFEAAAQLSVLSTL